VFDFDPRCERIQLARRRLAAAYARAPGHDVPVVDPGCGYARRLGTREMLEDFDTMLEHAAGWANALASVDQDWPPFIDTFVGVVLVPEAFGCRVVFTPGEDPWTEPALEDISGVRHLKPPNVGASPLIRRLSEWVDVAQRRLGTALPIWTMDIQSPFSVAARVVEPTQLLMACVTHPEEVHLLCRMITDFSIEMTRRHVAQMEHPGFPGRNFPSISDNIGICIADDTPLIMLGPDMYEEFSLPYNDQIGEAFGGVHIHSCGDYRHNLDSLLKMRTLKSIQIHAGDGEFVLPGSAAEKCAFNRARKQVTVFVDANGVSRGDAYRGRPKDHYAQYVLPRLGEADTTGLILQSCGPTQDLPDTQAAVDWTRAQITRRKMT
jgi:hypothetical protein